MRHRSRLTSFCAAGALAGAVSVLASPVRAAALPEGLLRLIPADAPAAIIVPGIKACSDEMTQWLDGMERGQLLLGSRPLDQLKSSTGFTVGIDDLGGMAVFIAGFSDDLPVAMVLVPVTDAQAFLNGNFTTHEGNRHSRADGLTLFARDLQSHVLMSQDEAALKNYNAGDGLTANATALLGDREAALVAAGDAFIIVQRGGINHMLQAARAKAARTEALLPGLAVFAMRLMEQCEGGITVIDFDPLALVLRSVGRMNPPQDAAAPLPANANSSPAASFNQLPSKAFYVAAAVHLDGLRASGLFDGLPQAADENNAPAWLNQISAAQFAAYPSPAGLAGGLLNDSLLVLESAKSEALLTQIRTAVLAVAQNTGSVKRDVTWEDNQLVKDAGSANLYSISIVDAPPEFAQARMIEQLLYGRLGWRGFVMDMNNAVIMTFSQRPAVLQGAIAVANDASKSMESAAVLRTMRQWMPAHRDVEVYLGLGQLAQIVSQAVEAFGMTADEMMTIDPAAPPVGFALNADLKSIESSFIIPAPIMAAVFDQFIKRAMQPADEPVQPAASNAQPPGGND